MYASLFTLILNWSEVCTF